MKKLLTLLLLSLLVGTSYGQYCNAVANCSQGDYIDDFTFASISRLNSNGSNCGGGGTSYINTGLSTNVTQGVKYEITMKGGRGGFNRQAYGVWIDFNGDLDFDDAGEFVYASPNASTNVFKDSVLIPLSAKSGSTRMRVRCLRTTTITAGQSCSTFNRGETEDYTVVIQNAPIPPLTDFEASPTNSCNGIVSFKDITPNNVTKWFWEFGDGDTSNLQHPTHTYKTSNTFTVKLTCTNSFGKKTETKNNYITVNSSSIPRSATCSPSTTSSAGGFGITKFSFGTLSHSSKDATEGYIDYSCIQASMTEGNTYPMTIEAPNAPANQNYRAWIDYNDDGVFTTSEEVLNQDQKLLGSTNVTIPAGTVLNKPLRVRVAAVYFLTAPASSKFKSCVALNNGQMEDYAIMVKTNTSPPKSDFEAKSKTSCDGTVEFTDLSTNLPLTWKWEFGDGNSSTQQNPTHTYANDGVYNVKLKVSNSAGTDTLTKSAYVTVDRTKSVKSACVPKTLSHREDYGITTVLFQAINNTSTDGRDGYQDFSCAHQASVKPNSTYVIEVTTGTQNVEDVNVWIDYNNDGAFDNTSEKVLTSLSKNLHVGNITISGSAVKGVSLRMRVQSEAVGQNLKPCDNTTLGQVEDYAIRIDTGASPNAPVADFTADTVKSCTGLINFKDMSTNNPTSWAWEFGDGNTSTDQNPQLQYQQQGIYTVKLTAKNNFGQTVSEKTAFIDYNEKYCGSGGSGPGSILENGLSSFKIYPNPASDRIQLHFQTNDVKNIDVSIMSLQGQVLYLENMDIGNETIHSINIADFSNGIYLIKIKEGDSIYSQKLFIQ